MSWPVAFVLGAIVSPTDPLAATEILRRLRVPRGMVSLIEGESLLNDGTALVAYNRRSWRSPPARSCSGTPLASSLVNAAGGIAIGLVAGKVLVEIRRRINDIPTEVTISLLSGYAGYLPAEALRRVRRARRGHDRHRARLEGAGDLDRVDAPEGYAVWEIIMFLLNALLFVLIGLQLPTILDGLRGRAAGDAARLGRRGQRRR